MFKRIFGHGRYATVTSTLALVVALSGTAYAAATVNSADIVNNSVRGIDIRTGAVASGDIANGAVAPVDVAPGSLGRSPRLFAHVRGDLALGGSSGVTAYSYSGGPIITFNRDVSQCAIIATPRAFPFGPLDANVRIESANGRQIKILVFANNDTPIEYSVDVVVVC